MKIFLSDRNINKISFLWLIIIIMFISFVILDLNWGNNTNLDYISRMPSYYHVEWFQSKKKKINNCEKNKILIKTGKNSDIDENKFDEGRVKWKRNIGTFLDILNPAIWGGNIYYGSNDIFFAFNSDGTIKWKNSHIHGGGTTVIGPDGTIYLAMYYRNGNGIYAINPNGKIKWLFTTHSVVDSIGAVGEDGTIYFVCRDFNLYAINPWGELKWKFKTENMNSSPSIGRNGIIYFGSRDGNAYAIYPDGKLKWKFSIGENKNKCHKDIGMWGTPAIGEDGTMNYSPKTGQCNKV